MKKRIGLVQTRGIGDIIIALPIADYYEALGFEIIWPIDARFLTMFQRIKPSISFFPVLADGHGHDFYLHEPLKIIRDKECDRTIILYSYLDSLNVCDARLTHAIKFDEYKYAISGVPFALKWTLAYERDMEREEALFNSLGITEKYLCFHGMGSNMTSPMEIPPDLACGYQVVNVEQLTDSPFDWLTTFERASKLVMLDSCFANLVEQMNLPNEKCLILRSDIRGTPVYKNGWRFISVPP